VSKRPALGKGMGALINAEYQSSDENNINSVIEVPIIDVSGNPDQPRKTFNANSLSELSASIKEKGVIQPILVEKSGSRYIIIAGERRYRASKLAGLEKIPVIVREFSENEKLEIAIIENIQREDLNPIEEAMAYHELMDKANFNQEEVAVKVGKNRSTVANSLRLLKLPKDIQDSLSGGLITAGHARAILSLDTESQMRDLHKRIVGEGLSVREAEGFTTSGKKMTRKKSGGSKVTVGGGNPELLTIQEKLIDKFGTKVNISGTLHKGKIEISYFSMDDLERLYEIIK
jgi:ParB family chromosome partitioning protein